MKLPDYYKADICEDYDPKDMKHGFAVRCPECKRISYIKILDTYDYYKIGQSYLSQSIFIHDLTMENKFCTQCGYSFIK